MPIYAFLKPCDVEMNFENALLSENSEEMLKFSAPLEQAFVEIRDWANNNGGKAVCSFGDQICIEAPMEKVVDLTAFMKKYEYTAKVNFCIGLGMNPLEAYKAMLSSMHAMGDKIVLYSQDLETEGLKKNNEEALQEQQWGLDLPGMTMGEEEPAAEDPAQAGQPPEQEKQTPKQKIVETLMMIRQKAPIIAQLKQVDPKAYEAVKKIIDAMISMAHGEMQKSEESFEETSEGTSEETSEEDLEKQASPGVIHKGKIKVEARDEVTRQKIGEHWHKGSAGLAMGKTGHPVSAVMPDQE